jgi:hypothetical protein
MSTAVDDTITSTIVPRIRLIGQTHRHEPRAHSAPARIALIHLAQLLEKHEVPQHAIRFRHVQPPMVGEAPAAKAGISLVAYIGRRI